MQLLFRFLKNIGKQNKESIQRQSLLIQLVNECKKTDGKKYDCIVGLSGGIDSSWALIEIELGLDH